MNRVRFVPNQIPHRDIKRGRGHTYPFEYRYTALQAIELGRRASELLEKENPYYSQGLTAYWRNGGRVDY